MLAALGAGCGVGNDDEASVLAADPGRALAQSAAALREQRTFTFEARFTRVKATSPAKIEEYATAEGALDLGSGAGRAELDLTPIFEGVGTEPFGGPVQLRWAGKKLTIVLAGETRTVSRARARADRGLIPRYPDEVEALADLLAHPVEPRFVGRDGDAARYAFAFDARAAGKKGVPAELSEAFKEALYGPRLLLEAWLEDDGLPHRISYAIHLEPHRGRVNLPQRTVRVTYELDDFGEPFHPGG